MNRDETDERVKRSLNDVRELAKAHEQLSEEIGSKFSEIKKKLDPSKALLIVRRN